MGIIEWPWAGGVFDHYFFNLDFPHSVSLFWLYVGLTVATIKVYRPLAIE